MSEVSQVRTSWQLARLAGCSDPDAHDGRGFDGQDVQPVEGSAGARFLRSVEDDCRDRLEDGDEIDDVGDVAHEVADGAVPVYTHERWSVFVDLAAYTEDLDELGGEPSDMTEAAGWALYLIGRRLAEALLEQDDDDGDEV